ncbi:MAG TPA: hypothetical protein VL973_04165 [Sphingomonas sp.]|nr:hypothetical protein [Sphingomonas sp.]
MGTLATRFALVFLLARYLDAASLGYYGLFTAATGYALLCVGLDLYVYTSREITKIDVSRRGQLLKSQATLVGLLYCVLIPVAVIVLPSAGLPEGLLWWFVPILVLEHLNQELYRLLIILSRQLTASLLLFVRQGSWAIAAAILMTVDAQSRNLDFVMALWAASGAVAGAIGLWQLYRLGMGGWRAPVDWAWLRKGVMVSGAFLVATLSVRAIQTVDRYWLESLAGIETVGAYVLFFGVASALTVFLDAAILSFRYPEMVAHAHQGEHEALHRKVRIAVIQVVAVSVAFSIISLILLPYLLEWIGQPVYLASMGIYYWVLSGIIAYSIGMVPHYALYALGHDRTLVLSHISALLIFIGATLATIPLSRAYAVPIGVTIAMVAVLLWKSLAYWSCARAHRLQAYDLKVESGLNA